MSYDVLDFPTNAHQGQTVIYIDEDIMPHVAWVALVKNRNTQNSDRSVCNLTILTHDGRVAARRNVEPAYHDGEKWHLINKWAFVGEIPEGELTPIPDQNMGDHGFIPIQVK